VDEEMVKTGLPALGLEVEVVNDQGKPVPWDGTTIGEIVIRGPWVTKEYYKEPDKTYEVWGDGWFHTGDIAKVDKEGFVIIADRLKDVIRSGAEMVPTMLLEGLIAKADFVAEALVVGVPDPVWGEKPMAIISLRPGMSATEADVVEFLLEHGVNTGKITKWMVPRLIAITTDLPKTSVGKYDKKAVRDDLDRFLAIAKDTSALH
jgi:fatty-acyl-CoA synthase